MNTLPGYAFHLAPPVRLAWIGEAWLLFCARKRVWLAVAAFQIGLAGLLCIGVAFVLSVNDHSPPTPSGGFWPDFWQFLLAWDILTGLCYLAVSALLAAGTHRMAVRQTRGELIGFRDLFRPGTAFFPSLCYALLGGVVFSMAWLFCLLPGWALTALLLPVPAQIAAGAPPWTAAAAGFRAMGSRWPQALGLAGVLCLGFILGLAPYLLGLLIIQPLLWLTAALSYRDMIDLPRQAPPPQPNYGPAQYGVWPPPPNMQ